MIKQFKIIYRALFQDDPTVLSQHEEEFLVYQDYHEKKNSGCDANAPENKVQPQKSHTERKKSLEERLTSATKEAKQARKKLKVSSSISSYRFIRRE